MRSNILLLPISLLAPLALAASGLESGLGSLISSPEFSKGLIADGVTLVSGANSAAKANAHNGAKSEEGLLADDESKVKRDDFVIADDSKVRRDLFPRERIELDLRNRHPADYPAPGMGRRAWEDAELKRRQESSSAATTTSTAATTPTIVVTVTNTNTVTATLTSSAASAEGDSTSTLLGTLTATVSPVGTSTLLVATGSPSGPYGYENATVMATGTVSGTVAATAAQFTGAAAPARDGAGWMMGVSAALVGMLVL